MRSRQRQPLPFVAPWRFQSKVPLPAPPRHVSCPSPTLPAFPPFLSRKSSLLAPVQYLTHDPMLFPLPDFADAGPSPERPPLPKSPALLEGPLVL